MLSTERQFDSVRGLSASVTTSEQENVMDSLARLIEAAEEESFSSDAYSVPEPLTVVNPNTAPIIEWLEWHRTTRNRQRTTLQSYAHTMSAWLTWIGATDIWAADVPTMEQFLVRPRRRRGAGGNGAPATRAREASTLRGFYTWAHARGYTSAALAENLHGPTVHNANPRPIPDADWIDICTYDLDDDARLALGLGFYCGLRRTELIDLRVGQVGWSKLEGFVRKGGGDHTFPWREVLGVVSERLPQLADGADVFRIILEKRRANGAPEDRLLRWTNPITLSHHIPQWFAAAGCHPYTPHQLRHSAVTNWLRAGIPFYLASRLANHSNPSVTMRYVRAGGDELAEWRNGLT